MTPSNLIKQFRPEPQRLPKEDGLSSPDFQEVADQSMAVGFTSTEIIGNIRREGCPAAPEPLEHFRILPRGHRPSGGAWRDSRINSVTSAYPQDIHGRDRPER